MKPLFLLVSIFSFFGVFSIDQLNEHQIPSFGFSESMILIILLLTLGYSFYWYRYSNTICFLIDKNIKELKTQISSNETDIDTIKEKIVNTRKKMFGIGKIGTKIKEVADCNISLWKDQVDIHQRIIFMCDDRISSLVQKQNELDLLNHLIAEVKNEPNTEEKLAKLEFLVSEIDDNVKLKFNSEVKKLIIELKTGDKENNIKELKDRMGKLESIAS